MAPIQRQKVLQPQDFSREIKRQKTTFYGEPNSRGVSLQSIRSISWNPIGTLIAVGSADRSLRIWNPEKPTFRQSTELRGHVGAVEKVAFNPRSETELASCGADGVVRFWDVRTKASINEMKLGGEITTLVWKPDGNEIVVGKKDDSLTPISRATFTTTSDPHKPTNKLHCTIFSHSGSEFIVSSSDGTIRILDYPTFAPLHTIRAHTAPCHGLDLSPTGSHLAIGGNDAIVSLWDTRDFICQRTLTGMDGPVRSLAFSFDGAYLVGGSDEGSSLEIASVETGEYVHKVVSSSTTRPMPMPLVAWHPHRYVLAYVEEGRGLGILGASWIG